METKTAKEEQPKKSAEKKRQRPEKKAKDVKEAEAEVAEGQPAKDVEMAEVKEEPAAAGAKRRAAAAAKSYKEVNARASKSDFVEIKEEAVCDNEAAALEETGGKAAGIKRRCVGSQQHQSMRVAGGLAVTDGHWALNGCIVQGH